jgi:S1-C subfamily serine protease
MKLSVKISTLYSPRKLLTILLLSIGVLMLACQEPGIVFPNIEATVQAVAATVVANQIPTPIVKALQPPTAVPKPTAVPTALPTVTPVPTPTPIPTPEVVLPDLTSVVAGVIPAVVAINTPAGTGSGFFFRDGLVMTNAHVVGNFLRATVVGEFGGVRLGLTGEVIGVDEDFDIAIISVGRNSDRHLLSFGDSDAIKIAEDVVVIGFPLNRILGESISVSKGVVSSKRVFEGVKMIQIDAATNPGNSGGPLINTRGEVIGMVTLKATNPATNLFFEGTGIAIASDTIKSRIPSLLDE